MLYKCVGTETTRQQEKHVCTNRDAYNAAVVVKLYSRHFAQD